MTAGPAADVVAAAAAVPFAIGVLVIVVGFVRVIPSGRDAPAELGGAFALGLEFFLAAGLIRLSAIDTFAGLGLVALTIAVRKLISAGVKESVRALLGGMAPRVRA